MAKGIFQPDYCVHPGATLEDWLLETGTEVAQLATLSGLSEQQLQLLLQWEAPIDEPIAAILADIIGPPVEFWLRYQQGFEDDCRRLGISAAEAARRWR